MTTNSVWSLGVFAVVLGAPLLANETLAQTQNPYSGVWNYDQPSAATGTNIGTIQCPVKSNADQGFVLVVPQIGNLTLTEKGDGRMEGRTDQGCT